MRFRVNRRAAAPICRQLADQVAIAAGSGTLAPGHRLPSARSLARVLQIDRNTVAKAYAELIRQGVIEIVAARYYLVTGKTPPLQQGAHRNLLTDAIDAAVVRAHRLSVDRTTFLRLARARLAVFERKTRKVVRPGSFTGSSV